MRKGITLSLDNDLIKKVRSLQARKLKNSDKYVSFSEVLEELAELGLKHLKKSSFKALIQGSLCSAGVAAGICLLSPCSKMITF